MRRRTVLAGLGGALTARSLSAQSPARKKLIGVLENALADVNVKNMQAFHRGMRERGHLEGSDYVIEARSAGGVAGQLDLLAAELVRLGVDVIVTRGTPAVLAAKRATSTIPIVMAASGGPLELGIVDSLARPGGNITGLSAFTTELSAKRVELARSLLPHVTRVALVNNMSNPVTGAQWEETRKAARVLGIEAVFLDVRGEHDIGPAFTAAVEQRVEVAVRDRAVDRVGPAPGALPNTCL